MKMVILVCLIFLIWVLLNIIYFVLVTKTEYIFVTDSEAEEEVVAPKVEEKPKLVQKKSSTTDSENDAKVPSSKGKKNKKQVSANQPSIMSFFKKS